MANQIPNRRDFNKSLLATGATLAAGASPLREAFARPARGGRLRVALHVQSAQDTLDPAKFAQTSEYARGFMLYNGLTRIDEAGEAVPELAESFESNGDLTEWYFKLRKGVTFQDGKTFDAEDAVYSIMRHKDPKVASASKGLVEDIVDVTADGKDGLRIKLSAPNADIPVLLGTFGFLIVKNGTTDFSTPVGTGPFRLKEFKPGVRTVVTRNENYFKSGRPYLDEIEYFGIADPVARLNALIAGDIHMMSDLRPNAIDEAKRASGIEVFSTRCPRFVEFAMMCDRAPTNNPDFRLAVKNLLDRERIVNQILKGYGVVANDHFVMPQSPVYNSSLPQRGVDIDKAKFHLKKAGMENANVELHVSEAVQNSIEMGLVLQREAARAGLTINLKREPSDGYWSNIWIKRPFHAVQWNPRPTESIMATLVWKSGAKWNDTQFKDTRLDQLIDTARGTVDLAKRKELFWEIEKIIYEQGGNAIPAFVSYIDAISSKVKGLSPIPTGNLGGFNFADSVWLEN
ncbi:ABC transporter substrate-binding protein [Bradyrhizobium sp. SSUT18]|uniref:ABC transporter substrate-binding protein n=1 Tax=Bradyrhizobium sp. SSUT18 TaxID=3040602 RepID=UPI00244A628F|nr:ABC transporter substrate-binding protein [Bradyrhizobium sp. SSUT18]MDH2405272.1 ABC transporter substrate-binding protein [Bradyrhizobium sp. SSUT18]